MVGTLGAVAFILAVVIAVIILWRINQSAVRSAVTWGEKLRLVFGLIFLSLAAYHLVLSGNVLYIAAAAIGFGFLAAYALVERPWKSVI